MFCFLPLFSLDQGNSQTCYCAGCDEASKAIVQEELDRRYLTFVVRRIVSVRSEFGVSHWGMESDRGTNDSVVRDVSENVLRPAPDRLVIVDVESNRF